MAPRASAETLIDLSGYHPGCEVEVAGWNGHLKIQWPITEVETGELTLDTSGNAPLIEKLVVRQNSVEAVILKDVDPVWFLTVGSREMPPGKPPEQKWEVFFDNPHRRPHEVFASKLAIAKAKVAGSGSRASVTIDGLAIGPFAGSLEFSFYAGSPLVRVDAVVATEKDGVAMFYDAGIVADEPSWKDVGWADTEGHYHFVLTRDLKQPASTVKVRGRVIAVDSVPHGVVACFPPPHQFQFPRDYSTNLGFVWHGKGYQGLENKVGFGIRQNKDGGGNFVPWFNAPPGTQQRLGMFLLVSSGNAQESLDDTFAYTRGDRFAELPGYKTLTSHWHMAIAVAAMEEAKRGIQRTEQPEYARIFREMGVNMVHLGEFHGDGHPKDPGPLRLPEMQAMFEECRRWSDDELLLIPGEEINDFLGLKTQGKHPGHWMSLFPRPVYWTQTRAADQPFMEEHPQYGKVYHVGSRGDMIRLIKEERALVWSAHPRIKASSWTPDIFREEDFFLAEYWLGGAWKAMPGDLSRERLGERVLNLLDDMANWGHKKYVLGEVDVFKIDHTHELFAHMNVNYVQMDRVPKYDEGWQPVLDTLSNGKFFVTTGEILIPKFTVGGKPSGDVLKRGDSATASPEPRSPNPELLADLQWTFPLAFAEVISGDGKQVYRERIELSDTKPFGSRTLKLTPDLRGRHWVRLEVWDIAANGAFTQPVWIE
ncbi:MAG TPA: hypothetical protein VFV87_02235 [Pirellulaceae bacterium]|nr:hypothetical protein [Pirellulaceae bacterium]